ncbi:MAG: alpha/beta hydrolase [Alkalibacterium sp.]|nr:alpha/beta hydrolase [Alkalibacterium sp.]
MKTIQKNWKKIVLGCVILLAALLVGLFIFVRVSTYEAMEEAKDLLNDTNVMQEDNWIKIEPEVRIGTIVFYQGAFVEAESYLPLAKSLSDQGFRVFIPYMPLNLAILNTRAFERIYDEYASDEEWVIGGHSLGGASASLFVADQDEHIDGVFFLASYPSANSDLSNRSFPVLSITASHDIIVDDERFNESRENLPDHTVFSRIEGGNHSNFGYYGFQSGDGISQITREEQHEQVVQTIISVFLEDE